MKYLFIGLMMISMSAIGHDTGQPHRLLSSQDVLGTQGFVQKNVRTTLTYGRTALDRSITIKTHNEINKHLNKLFNF